MHIDLVELLRCPRAHEESWLVLAISAMDGRDVVQGRLGCPVCSAEYQIEDGEAVFSGSAEAASARPRNREPAHPTEAEEAIRLAAFLGLTDPGGVVVLTGAWGSIAERLAELTAARVMALNAHTRLRTEAPAGAIFSAEAIPLGADSVDGVALDENWTTPVFLAEAARVIRPGGRLVAAADAGLPAGFTQLVRDERIVVAEAPVPVVSLRRQRRD